jgi:hypothetical protein
MIFDSLVWISRSEKFKWTASQQKLNCALFVIFFDAKLWLGLIRLRPHGYGAINDRAKD